MSVEVHQGRAVVLTWPESVPCLTVALLTALFAAGASIYGGVRGRREWVASGRRAVYCVAALCVVAFAILESAFLRSDFSYRLVAEGSSTSTPTFYKITAVWATQDGSLLLWATLLGLFASAVLFLTRRSLRDITPGRPPCSAAWRPSSCS